MISYGLFLWHEPMADWFHFVEKPFLRKRERPAAGGAAAVAVASPR